MAAARRAVMAWIERLPTMPEWVPFPKVVWFVLEGIALGIVGVLVRDLLGPLFWGVTTLGNVVFFVGSATAMFGALAWVVLYLLNR